jgi:hypothetical protein
MLFPVERRMQTRFPIELNVHYRTLSKRAMISGAGRTLNISSAGLLVASPDELRLGTRLHLTLEWPCLLDATTPLQLVTLAKVVRRDRAGFAVTIASYQFRTLKRRAVSPKTSYAVA